MLDETQVRLTMEKLKLFLDRLEVLIFEEVDRIDEVDFQQTKQTRYDLPSDGYTTIRAGQTWGEEGAYGYFRTSYTVPDVLAGTPLFLMPKTQGYESLLWVDGQPFGTYATKIVQTTHGNHYCDLIRLSPAAGECIDLCVECYCGHFIRGDRPFMDVGRRDFTCRFDGFVLCQKNEQISDFYFDLRTLTELVDALDKTSYRRADVMNTLEMAHRILYLDIDNIDRATFMAALEKAHTLLKPQLAKKNGDTAPFAGFIGHSHMDTAWLWHIGETVKKCARTYSNQLSLMQQYPEHRFIQSSAYHSQMMLEHYPQLFEAIRHKVLEKQYEPNGAVYVECDCNITGGESMVRQFLWGQRFTREHYNYTSDTFWLPDTFGYSAAIPQIMRQSGVKYFVTTKLSWNDTTDFPYDSFAWSGLDGTQVIAHFPKTHDFPCPRTLAHFMYTKDRRGDVVKDKRLSQMKLIGYGFGDGGGGPQFEQLEMARRLRDLEGMPRTDYVTVSQFMKKLESSMPEPPVYSGELYLEYHRGTLTNQHEIKRNNRKCEIALHDLELLTVMRAVACGAPADGKAVRPMMQTLLINQFHDILPGTGIPRVNEEARRDVGEAIAETTRQIGELLTKAQDTCQISLTNTLSFSREDVVYLDVPAGYIVKGDYAQQRIRDTAGKELLAVAGVHLPAMGTVTLWLVPGEPVCSSAFATNERQEVVTPFAAIRFDEKGAMESFVDTRTRRQLRDADGHPLNTLLMAEDVSLRWDSWDIDPDLLPKLQPTAQLLSRRVVADGPVEMRIECEYRLSERSTLTQQTILSAFTPEIRFDTVIHWQDDHRFLKAAFDTTIFTDTSREEIQFGYAKRATTSNTPQDIAKFEVSCHKYADLSESRYGVAILNDCKYGVYAKGGSLWLSLHKGGCNPDFTGDHGDHRVQYAMLPHAEGFTSRSVIQPAYCFNYAPQMGQRPAEDLPALLSIDADDVLCEAVKPCEDVQCAYIVRLYEAEGATAYPHIRFGHDVKKVMLTNMLEENQREVPVNDGIDLTFRPFEIKTLRVYY